jgi:membrane protease YdiL (CAAX protease family)
MTQDAPAPTPPEGTTETDGGTSAALRGLGLAGVTATVLIVLAGPVFEPLGTFLTWLWARWSRTPWRDLGLVRPRSIPWTVVSGIAAGALFKLAMKSVVMPLLGAPPLNPAYHWLAGDTRALPGMLFDVTVGAGLTEELVFRGFLFLQLRKALGPGARARVLIVLVTSLYFGALHHAGQGLAGAEQAVITGLAFGTFYATTGRLWPVVIAHAAFDVTAVGIIYADLETTVARWFFR